MRIKKSGLAKTLSLCLALSAAFICPSVGSHAEDDIWSYDNVLSGYQLVYGDANTDGEINAGDSVSILSYCTGTKSPNAMQLLNADVNCDNKVNIQDAIILLRYTAGLVSDLPVTDEAVFDGESFSFYNSTFPENGMRISYNKSYSLNGTVMSDYPIRLVRVKITDVSSGNVEIDKAIHFNVNDNMKCYNTATSPNAIDNCIKFASLSTGEKKIQVLCNNTKETNIAVYESNFRVGFSYSEVAGYVYTSGDCVSQEEARKVLALLNTLDCTRDRAAKVVTESISNLGESYGTMDCSRFVQLTIRNSLGLDIPRTSEEQAIYCRSNGYNVPFESRQIGDILFMRDTGCDCGRYHEIHHSAIYLGEHDGTEYIIESSSSLGGVIIRRIWGTGGGRWLIDSVGRLTNAD